MFIQKKCSNLKKIIQPILKENTNELVKTIKKVTNQQQKINKNNTTTDSAVNNIKLSND